MNKVKAVFALTAALAFLMSPFFSSGFNGFTPDQFQVPQVDPPVQPAGYAFAIWGLIYIWLFIGAGFGLLNRDTDSDWDAMRWPYIISLSVGAAWIPVAQLSPVWATILICIMLATSLWALLTCGARDRLWQRSPIALYSGWLTAASCVALGLVLAGYGILGAQTAAICMVLLALVLASLVLKTRPDTPEYAVSVVWALIGIIAANLASENWTLIVLCAVGIVALSLQVIKALR